MPSLVSAAVPIDYGAAANSDTTSITVPSGTTVLLVLTNVSGGPVDAVTFDGVSLTKMDDASQLAATTIEAAGWMLKNPTAKTANLVSTFNTANGRGGCTVYYLNDVDLTPAISAYNTASSATTPAATCTVTTATGHLIIDNFGRGGGDSITAFAPDANQTEQTDFIGSTGASTNTRRIGSSTQAGADGGVMSWSFTGGSAGTQAIWAVSLPPVAGPTITVQPSAQTKVLTNANTATFSCTATGTGTVDLTAEIETSAGSGTFTTLANGSDATWTGLTATGSASASATTVGTFTAKTQTGKKIRFKADDDNGTSYSNEVLLTL